MKGQYRGYASGSWRRPAYFRDPRRALTLPGFAQLGTFSCAAPCAHAPPASLYIASLSSSSYISSMVLSPDALATLPRAKSWMAHARRSRTTVRPTCAILQSPPILLPSPYRPSAHPRCVELLQAAPRHINCSSPPSLTDKRAPFLSRAPTEPNPEFGKCLLDVTAAQLSRPPAPLSRGLRVILHCGRLRLFGLGARVLSLCWF